jgi:hypothetical protein
MLLMTDICPSLIMNGIKLKSRLDILRSSSATLLLDSESRMGFNLLPHPDCAQLQSGNQDT